MLNSQHSSGDVKQLKLVFFHNRSSIVRNQILTEAGFILEVHKLPCETVNLDNRKFTDTRIAVLSFSSSADKNNLRITL